MLKVPTTVPIDPFSATLVLSRLISVGASLNRLLAQAVPQRPSSPDISVPRVIAY